MHWTAFLAYRRIPAEAQVVGDVHCVSCGYNLRGLRARGNCPECGSRVADSLFILTRPEVVAVALRSFSNSYYTLLLMPLGCVGMGAVGWPMLVAACFIAGGALYRALHAGELRYRAQLRNLTVLDSRVRWLWIVTLIEIGAAFGWIAMILLSLYVTTMPAAISGNLVLVAAGVWLCSALATAAAAGWLGLGLATTLGYGWMVIELRIQLTVVGSTALVGGLLGMLLTAPMSRPAFFMLAGMLVLMLLTTFALTWVAMHQVANAAEQEYGSWEEMLESDLVAIVPEEQRGHNNSV